MEFDFGNKHVHLEKGDIFGLIALFIPVVRIFGIFWLIKVVRRKLHLTKGQFWGIIALGLFVLGGGVGELFGTLSGLFLPLTIVSVLILGVWGYFKNNESKDVDYASFFDGLDSVSIEEAAKAMGVSEKRLMKDFNRLRKKHIVPYDAYVDHGEKLIVLTKKGRPVHEKKKPAPVYEPPKDESTYDKIVHDIRRLNDEIDDEVVSEKMYHIEDTTANIFDVIKQKPERAGEIQVFMEYYLPTTLALLEKYARLEKQKSGGENINAAKKRIEGIMDKVVEGFDAQLDKLFKSEAIDITADVKTLEKMMKMDGMTGKGQTGTAAGSH